MKIACTRHIVLFSVIVLALGNAFQAFAQISSQTGAITGTVADPSGAVVPNATVSVTSSRGFVTSKQSSSNGSFSFPLLEPGSYDLKAEAPGFKQAVLQKVVVHVTEVTNLSISLQVGAADTVVSVEATSPLVNSTNATMGDELTGQVIEALPLATRNFTNLLGTNAGTSQALPDASLAGRGGNSVYVNGQRNTANNLVINGIDANNLGNNNFGGVSIPAPDTIEEFRVQTSLYDASQGKTSGGNINVVTKSGTTSYHGEAYEFFRNNALNANSWFFNHNNVKKAVLKQHQFGGNFGGPVPKFGRTFFFGSYQGTRQRNGLSSSISQPFPVLPAQRTQAAIESAFGLNPGSLDPVTLKLLNAPGQYGGFLVPGGTGKAPGSFGTVNVSAPLQFTDNQFNVNFDHEFSSKQRLSTKWFRAEALTFDPLGGEGATNLGSGETRPLINNTAALIHTYTFGPSVLNEARVGFNRIQSATMGKDPATLSDLGMTRSNGSVFSGIPIFFTDDINPAFGGISTNNDQASASNTFSFGDTLSYTVGQHSIRAGADYRRYQINTFNNFASRGFLEYATFKDLLLGNIERAFYGSGNTDRGFRARDIAIYGQDDFKVTPRLTVNLGIRWDYLGPSVERKDKVGNFDPSRLDAATLASGGAGLLNGFTLPATANFGAIKGTPGVDRSAIAGPDYNNVAPRVGFAWDPLGDGKTAVRGGYGIYYVRTSNQTLLQLITAAPFFQQSSVFFPGTPNSNPFPALALPSQFPIFPRTPALTGFTASGNPTFTPGVPLLALNPIAQNLRTPYAQHYNFSIERQLPGQIGLEVGYLGSQGVKLLRGIQVNQALLANSAAPIRTLTTNTGGNVNARVSVIGFSPTGLNEVTNRGHSNYNALAVSAKRRVRDMFLQVAYTFSKSQDNNSGSDGQDLGNSGGNQLDPQDPGLRSLSNFDRTHRLIVTYNYQLPGFKSGFLHPVFGGWSISGTTTFQSALPINFLCSGCSGNVFGQLGTFPNIVGDINQLMKSGDPHNFVDSGTAFNNSVLALVPSFPAGTLVSGLNQFGGPGNQSYPIGGRLFGTLRRNPGQRGQFQQQWDFAVNKEFPIYHESVRGQFGAQFFNLFNHPIFDKPFSTFSGPTGTSFGQITSTVTAPRIIQFVAKVQF